ncbi:MAG TPA: glycine cleavage system protein GcvH [Myxococcota bacterium]|nr:glycine cleavage system protein GcvH [Myxococcota bacterium]HRY95058.1 glycine cleavage system protein GcvH [Myxococcota bacterium]HSA20487.1 glycine cleavage system protein GcvH [Myxococcota bacterium]
MNIPATLKYTKDHEWVRVDGKRATIGITDYAQEELGDIVNIELPSEGDLVTKEDSFAAVESVKASSEVFAPVSGKVVEVNEPLMDSPETINAEPYDDGWMVRIEMSKPAELDGLMDAAAYTKYVEEESK